jgi:hypothetical protein
MDGIASKVAEEVLVLFEDCDRYTFAGEQKAEHDAGRAATDDATGRAGESPSALRHPATVAGAIVLVNARMAYLRARNHIQFGRGQFSVKRQ